MFRTAILIFITVTVLKAEHFDKRNIIHPKAYPYLDTIYKECKRLVPEMKEFWYFPALIEHESGCITLNKHSFWYRKCFNPKARLKTKREEGAGLFQITRAWNKIGRLRFDNLRRIKRKYPNEVYGVNWKNIYRKPEMQIRIGILIWRDTFYKFSKKIPLESRIAFNDSAYNGGLYYLNRERKICALKKNCNPNLWFDNVEKIRGRRARHSLYGKRSAFDINRNHVRDCILIRSYKYKREYYENNRDLK